MRESAGPGLHGANLSARRGNQRLFQDLSFSLSPGQLVWLRGQNGSGKTTLLRMVAGLTRPEAGDLTWNGRALSAADDYHASLTYLGHTQGLKDDLTARESLLFLAQLHGQDCSIAQADGALRRLNIHHRRKLPVRMLSQGQRKRVALSRLALHHGPGLWVLDEPFDALDDSGIAIVQGLLQEHIARQGCVLMTSHIAVAVAGVQTREISLDPAVAA